MRLFIEIPSFTELLVAEWSQRKIVFCVCTEAETHLHRVVGRHGLVVGADGYDPSPVARAGQPVDIRILPLPGKLSPKRFSNHLVAPLTALRPTMLWT